MNPAGTPDTLQSRQLFETLRARLLSLSEALFDKAPFSRQASTSGFRGSGADLLTLCRGLGSVDLALRRFEASWHRLRVQDGHVLLEEWDSRLERLVKEARERCSLCLVSPGTEAPRPVPTAYDCSACGTRVVLFAEELEGWSRRLVDTLEVLTPMSTPQIPHAPDPTSAPSPAPTELATSATAILDGAAESRITELEAKCKDLEAKCAAAEAKCHEYSEILDQTQNALEAANGQSSTHARELEGLRKARDGLVAVNMLLEEDLKEAVENIERFAEDLDELMRWGTAQSAYAQLHRLLLRSMSRIEVTAETEAQRRDLEVKAMRYKHKQSVALMRLGRHQEAEVMCQEVWENRGLLEAGTSKAVVRGLLRDYCDILVRNGKHDIAEQQYQLVLWTELHGTTDREDEKERFLIYSRLGDIKMEQKRYVDAARLHKEALEKVMQLLPLDVDQAAECAVKCLASQRMQDDSFAIMDNTIGSHLRTIWSARRRNSEKPAVLACGHEHGVRLLNEDKDEEAVTVLSKVWERRKALGEECKSDAMETALCLVDVSVKTENLARLETLYYWITQNPTADQGEADRLWARYRLGCVQAVLQKYAVAETNLRRALSRQKELFGPEDPDTLQYTQLFAEVLRRERRNDDAAALVKGVWETRQRYPRSVLQAVLRCGHAYGDILSESNEPRDLATAEAVLREVWEETSLNLTRMAVSSSLSASQLSGLVSSGDCFGLVLMKRQKFAAAKEVLAPVLDWKRWPPLNVDPAGVERTSYLLGKANELEVKESVDHKKIKYQPSVVHYHPLRLRHILDRWLNTNTVTGFIANS